MASQVDPYKSLEAKSRNQQVIKLTTNAPFTPTYVQSSLTQVADPYAIYAARVKNRHILLENPARTSKAQKERDEKKIARKALKKKLLLLIPPPPPLSRRSADAKGLWKLEKGAEKFDLFIPLHHLWAGYMSELLGLSHPSVPAADADADAMPNTSSMHAKLVKADFHGSLLTVCKSKNPCLIGLSGIMIHETENAFKLVTRDDRLVLIPKQNSIFTLPVPLYSTLPSTQFDPADMLRGRAFAPSTSTSTSTGEGEGEGNGEGKSGSGSGCKGKGKNTVLDAPHIAFDLHGNQFRFRSADRAGRKFKAKETIEL